jgi:hypothetical protein
MANDLPLPPAPALIDNLDKIYQILRDIIALGQEDNIVIYDITQDIVQYYDGEEQSDGEFNVYVDSNYSLQQLHDHVIDSIESGPDTWMDGDIYAVGYVMYSGKVYLSKNDYEYNVDLVDIVTVI